MPNTAAYKLFFDKVRESISNGIYINRLCEKKVDTFDEVIDWMNKGDEYRNIAATKVTTKLTTRQPKIHLGYKD
jgi:hypothetical protein